jgi:hypothetical protein
MNFGKLISSISGRLILPENDNYDEARKIYNAMIDKYPAAILKCKTEEDIVQGVLFARSAKMDLAVKSGGHNGAGFAMCDDGLVIDLSEMKGIEVDPEKQIALVESGNTLGEIDKAIHVYGLALPSGINSTTGIGGITLGGGLGYFSRKAGLTIDNLIGARVVLASGDIVDCNENQYPDLFWALRGGGGNFGIVVSFTFRLIQQKTVYAGPMFWPFDKAKEVIQFYDRFTKKASNDLYGFFAFVKVPPGDPFPEKLHNKTVCGIVWNYTGPAEQAEEIFKPVRSFGPPVFDMVGEIPIPVLNSMFDALYPKGMQWYWKAHYVNEISESSIAANIKYAAQIPSLQSTMHYYPIDGKVWDVRQEDTAWANRDVRWVQLIVGVDPDPANKEKVTHWCRQYYDAMIPFAKQGAYINFMMKEGVDKIKAAYGKNYGRLVEVKKKYDPYNFFHLNQNIKAEYSI